MEKQSQLSDKERKTLIIYGLSFAAVIIAFFILDIVRKGFAPPEPTSGVADLAILAPLSGPQAELGLALLNVVGNAVYRHPQDLTLEGFNVSVTGYDTGGTADGAANAALQTARNPNTVAIIGPLDARQAIAISEVLQGKGLSVITPSSTSPALPIGSIKGLYRIPAPDNMQGKAIVDFLLQQGLQSEVFLISGSSSNFANEVTNFKESFTNQIVTVDEIQIESAEDQDYDELAQRIKSSGAELIAFLGEKEDGSLFQNKLEEADLNLPLLSDTRGQNLASKAVEHPSHTSIFLIAEPTTYVQNILETFNQAAQEKLHVVGTLNIGQDSIPESLGVQIKETQANAVVYLGSSERARQVLQSLNQENQNLPFVSSDALNDPSLLPLPGKANNVYYASSILNLSGLPENETLDLYRQALDQFSDDPYAYESIQATWLVLGALTNQSLKATARELVWNNLSRMSVLGLNNTRYAFSNGQRSPINYYIYKVDSAAQAWEDNPIVYIDEDN